MAEMEIAKPHGNMPQSCRNLAVKCLCLSPQMEGAKRQHIYIASRLM